MTLTTKLLSEKFLTWFFIVGFVVVSLGLLICRGMVYLPSDGLTNVQQPPYWMADSTDATIGDYHKYLLLEPEWMLDSQGEYHGLSIRKTNRLSFFKAYLIVDFLFAFFLVGFICVLGKEDISKDRKGPGVRMTIFAILGGLAFICDIVENASLLLWKSLSLSCYSTVHLVKNFVFGLFFLLIALKLFELWKSRAGRDLRKILIGSFLSLIVVIFLILLLTKMPQGVNLMVDLFSDLPNTMLFFFLITVSAVIISNFAKFVYIRIYEKDHYKWVRADTWWPIIYHDQGKDEDHKSNIESLFRHFIGSIFIIACFYAYLYAWNKTNLHFPPAVVAEGSLLLGLVSLLLHVYLYKILCKFKYKKEVKQERAPTYRWIFVFILVNVASLILYICRIFTSDGSDWIRLFPCFQFLFILLGYIIFRELRPAFGDFFTISKKYRYAEIGIKEKGSKGDLTMGRGVYLQTGEKDCWFHKVSQLVGNVTNRIYFLQLVSIILVLLFFCFLLLPFFTVSLKVNGVNYLLAYLIIYYSFIVTFLILQFYKSPSSEAENGYVEGEKLFYLADKKYKFKFLKNKPSNLLSYIAFIFIAGGIVILSLGNNLHLLRPIYIAAEATSKDDRTHFASVQESELEINRDEYLDLYFGNMDTCNKNIVAITAFGGGLKANYNVLRTLTHMKDSIPHLMDHTVIMSGVSGGGVGLANYNLLDNYKDYSNEIIDQKVDSIGDLNILSLDLYHLFYLDLARMFIPGNPNGKIGSRPLSTRSYGHDRSYHAMKQYERIILPDEDLSQVAYQQVHKRIFDEDLHSPILLMNSTSTSLEYGLASSLTPSDKPTPGSINILKPLSSAKEAEQYTLSYYDAVSTVNRFPLMSPAAKIKDAGHFVDGGYFENSGILSCISSLDRLFGHKWSPNHLLERGGREYRVNIINLLNGKAHWINYVLGKYEVEQKSSVNSSSQIGAIIKTVTGTEMLPNFFVEALNEETEYNDSTFTFIPFYIPYRLSMQDINQYLGGKPYDHMEMRKAIERNNFMIDSVLVDCGYQFDWGIVEPALSRKLSRNDKRYQDIMIKYHPINQEGLELLQTNLTCVDTLSQ